MTAGDRAVVVAIAFMYAAIPLDGTFALLDPLRAPFPPLLPPAAVLAFGALVLAAAGVCAWGAVRRPPPRRILIAQLGAGVAIVPGALLGFDPRTGLELALIVLALGLPGTALYGYAALPGVTRTIVFVTLASAAASGALALAMLAARAPAAIYAYNNGRALGTFINPNELAAYLLVVLALAAGVVCFARGAGLRVPAGLTLAIGLGALAATFSRWGFASALAGLAVFAAWTGGRRAWAGLGCVALAAVLLVAGPGRGYHNPRDDASRLVAWTTGARTWLAFPLTGVGPLAFRRTYDVLRPPEAPGGAAPVAFDPHSLPLAYLSESGLIGFAALLICWSVYLREIPRAARAAGPRRRALVYAAAAGLVALNVHVLANTISIYFALAPQGAALVLALAQRELDATPA
jgi:hypothetical protein